MLAGTLLLWTSGVGPAPGQESAAGVEATLRAARRTGLPVLRLAPSEGVLEVRVDDLVLQRLPVRRVSLLRHGDGGGDGSAAPPHASRVASLPIGDDPTPPEITSEGKPIADEGPPAASREVHYRVPLDSGPQLLITEHPLRALPERSLLTRLADGWLELRGRARERPDLLVVELAADDARSIHHLFRPGVPIVFEPSTPPQR